jgi:hypothetical protein
MTHMGHHDQHGTIRHTIPDLLGQRIQRMACAKCGRLFSREGRWRCHCADVRFEDANDLQPLVKVPFELVTISYCDVVLHNALHEVIGPWRGRRHGTARMLVVFPE